MVMWLPKSDVQFIPAFVSVSDFVLAPPILVPRLDTSVDSTYYCVKACLLLMVNCVWHHP